MRVLLVEDDALVAAGIEAGLALSDFVVDTVTTRDANRDQLRYRGAGSRSADGDGLTLL